MPRLHSARRAVALACAAALALALAACAPQTTAGLDLPSQVDGALPDDTQAQLQTAVDRAVAAAGASGAVVGVWAPWAGTWLKGSGTSKPGGSGIDATASFVAGAVTRSMTCDVLYGMVADGTVALDDSVTEYVPGLPGREGLTLGALCDSTTGLASYGGALAGRIVANPDRAWNPRELVSYGLAESGETTTGTTFADSDTGYVLLGMALENAARKPAAELLAHYVFEPNGMTASSLPATADTDLDGLWSGNGADGAVACGEPVDLGDVSSSVGYTASGVVSDLADLGRYTEGLALGLRAYDSADRFGDRMPAAADAPSWFTADGGAYQAGTLVGQYGSSPGYLTAAFADSKTGMTVVVALNNSRASATLVRSLAWQLAAIASKAPAAAGQTAPEAGLPWTADDMGAQVTAAAVCPIP